MTMTCEKVDRLERWAFGYKNEQSTGSGPSVYVLTWCEHLHTVYLNIVTKRLKRQNQRCCKKVNFIQNI